MEVLAARTANKAFLAVEIVRARLAFNRSWQILFSPSPGWEPAIRRGFRHTRHHVAFEPLTEDNIRACDLVVPLSIGDLKQLAAWRCLVPNNPIPIPTLETVLLYDDKFQWSETLAAKGFSEYLPKSCEPHLYPYVLKKRIDAFGQHVHFVLNAHDAQTHADLLDHPDYLRQEVVSGPFEYATHILMRQGQIVSAINVQYAFGNANPVKGRDRASYTRVCSCPYLELFADILTATGFDGLCCVNYKVRDNRPLLLEINPRFGGSLTPLFFSMMRHLG